MLLLCLFFVFSVGEGMGEGDLVVMLGALSVAREGRVPLVLVLLAVFALAYVDVAAKIALDRAVAVFGPSPRDTNDGPGPVGFRARAVDSCERLAL